MANGTRILRSKEQTIQFFVAVILFYRMYGINPL